MVSFRLLRCWKICVCLHRLFARFVFDTKIVGAICVHRPVHARETGMISVKRLVTVQVLFSYENNSLLYEIRPAELRFFRSKSRLVI